MRSALTVLVLAATLFTATDLQAQTQNRSRRGAVRHIQYEDENGNPIQVQRRAPARAAAQSYDRAPRNARDYDQGYDQRYDQGYDQRYDQGYGQGYGPDPRGYDPRGYGQRGYRNGRGGLDGNMTGQILGAVASGMLNRGGGGLLGGGGGGGILGGLLGGGRGGGLGGLLGGGGGGLGGLLGGF